MIAPLNSTSTPAVTIRIRPLFDTRTERPMKIEIVLDPSRPAPPASLAARVAPAPAAAAPADGARGGGRPRRGRGGGSGGGGGGGGRRKNERPNKSVADLDAEMEDYTASNAPAA
ncbi:hypothetical protein EVJ58_g10888 [Rhodofomes roseus]|uniref:Chromatin target of PRMT1 protein C-terminal domain-containing protein n=1 Tax=Rhodofomes roseus TaxID=34475 RepID=A0A4Y9XL67_9APHY|nr:hypothetical protein EVJ58_g10888 [Rhodofomes roseus]